VTSWRAQKQHDEVHRRRGGLRRGCPAGAPGKMKLKGQFMSFDLPDSLNVGSASGKQSPNL